MIISGILDQYDNQFGFQKRKCTYMAMVMQIEKISRAFVREDYIIGAFFNYLKLETMDAGFNRAFLNTKKVYFRLTFMRVFNCWDKIISVLPNRPQLFLWLHELYVQNNSLTSLPDLFEMTSQFKFYAVENSYVYK